MEWDPAKRLSNLRKHGLDFRDAAEFDLDQSSIRLDDQPEPYEEREVATGFWRNKICVLVYARRHGVIRVISFRKASRREAQEYVENSSRST